VKPEGSQTPALAWFACRCDSARPEDIASMTWRLTDKLEYLARASETGKVYREAMGRHFPAMAAVQVSALIEDRAEVEIQAVAVVVE
jgi:enamine deaminase RidA (YjgF/YER057c/UK114 family)